MSPSATDPALTLVVTTESPAWHLRRVLTAAIAARGPEVELLVVDAAGDDVVRWIVDDVLGTAGEGSLTIPGGGRLLRMGHATVADARAAGQERARGRHVLHLDGRTVLQADGLRRLVARLVATDPELVLLDVDEVRWWGKPRPRSWHEVIAALGGGRSDVASAPDLVRLLLRGPIDVPALVVRRDLGGLDAAAWRGGAYAERGWLLRLLLSGHRVEGVGVPVMEVVRRRQHRDRDASADGSIDLFARTADLLEVASLAPRTRTLLLDRALRDALQVRDDHRERWSVSERRRFVRACRTHLGARVGVGERPSGRRARLLLTGANAALELVDLVRGMATWWRTRGRQDRPSWTVRRTRAVAWFARHLPLRRDLVVFSAYGGRSVACNPLAIHDELRRQAPDVASVWVVRRGVPCPPGVRCVRPGTSAYHFAVGRARVLVNNYNFGLQVPFRRRTLNLQTQHGTPLKTVGVDQHGFPGTAGGASLASFVRRYQRWDIVLSPSRHASEVLHRSFPGRYRVWHTGFPRNDVLLHDDGSLRAATRDRLGIGPTERVILFVPTFRDRSDGFDPQADLRALADGLGPGTALLVRAHYFDRSRPAVADPGATVGHGGGRLLDVSDEPSIEALYLASDVLVTDYSSAMFDYSVLGRPIVLYVPDHDAYRARRGLYLDLVREAPGPVTRDEGQLLEALRTVGDDLTSAGRVAAFRARYAEFEDGHAAQRVVRELVLPAVRRRRGWRARVTGSEASS